MSEQSTPPPDIEDLAARAREMLLRVKGVEAPPSADVPDEPVVEASEPTIETPEPVLDVPEPAFEASEPTIETAEPVLDAPAVQIGEAATLDLDATADISDLLAEQDLDPVEISDDGDLGLFEENIDPEDAVQIEDFEVETLDIEVEVETPDVEILEVVEADDETELEVDDDTELDAPDEESNLSAVGGAAALTGLAAAAAEAKAALSDDTIEIETPEIETPEIDTSEQDLDVTDIADSIEADLEEIEIDEPDHIESVEIDPVDEIEGLDEGITFEDVQPEQAIGFADEVEIAEAELTPPSLDDDPGFTNVDFGDILSSDEEIDLDLPNEGTGYVESFDADVTEVAAEMGGRTPKLDPSLAPAAGIDGNVDELFAKTSTSEEIELATTPKRGRWKWWLLLLLALILFLVFFGSQLIDWLTADEPDEVGTATTTTSVVVDETDETNSTTPASSVEPAEATTSTQAEETTTTSTASTTTEAPLPESAWELLGAASGTNSFASIGEPLGLQGRLAELDDYTLFAPSDAAVATLTPEDLGTLAEDPDRARALLDYHIVPQRLSAEDLLRLNGNQLETVNGLPLLVRVEGDTIILNGTTRIDAGDLESQTGTVHVIDSVLSPPTINEILELGNIQFEVISSRLTPAGIAELEKAVTYFEENPDASALIAGHTDTDGEADANQRLSERRANAVRTFLVEQGIAADRLVAQGFGESQPILVNGTEDKAASRRIEFILR